VGAGKDGSIGIIDAGLQKSIYPSSEYRIQEERMDDNLPELRWAQLHDAEIKHLSCWAKLDFFV
jgi:hypothetical protein